MNLISLIVIIVFCCLVVLFFVIQGLCYYGKMSCKIGIIIQIIDFFLLIATVIIYTILSLYMFYL